MSVIARGQLHGARPEERSAAHVAASRHRGTAVQTILGGRQEVEVGKLGAFGVFGQSRTHRDVDRNLAAAHHRVSRSDRCHLARGGNLGHSRVFGSPRAARSGETVQIANLAHIQGELMLVVRVIDGLVSGGLGRRRLLRSVHVSASACTGIAVIGAGQFTFFAGTVAVFCVVAVAFTDVLITRNYGLLRIGRVGRLARLIALLFGRRHGERKGSIEQLGGERESVGIDIALSRKGLFQRYFSDRFGAINAVRLHFARKRAAPRHGNAVIYARKRERVARLVNKAEAIDAVQPVPLFQGLLHGGLAFVVFRHINRQPRSFGKRARSGQLHRHIIGIDGQDGRIVLQAIGRRRIEGAVVLLAGRLAGAIIRRRRNALGRLLRIIFRRRWLRRLLAHFAIEAFDGQCSIGKHRDVQERERHKQRERDRHDLSLEAVTRVGESLYCVHFHQLLLNPGGFFAALHPHISGCECDTENTGDTRNAE